MSENDISLKISSEVVKPIVEAKIQAAIVAALGDGRGLIEATVERVLKQKVDSKGQHNRYDYENSYSFIELICGNIIRETARNAIQEWVHENKSKIQEEIKKHLAKQGNALSTALVNSLVESVVSKYSSNVTISFKENSR